MEAQKMHSTFADGKVQRRIYNKSFPFRARLVLLVEFFERLAYHSIKSTLFIYLIACFGYSRERSVSYVHGFIFLSYLSTVLGGMVADKGLGKLFTVCLFFCAYLAGALLLFGSAVIQSTLLLKTGLLLVSVSAGCIKPAVSSLGGEQFDEEDKRGISLFFTAFYFSVNLGSGIAIFSMPAAIGRKCFGENTCYSFGYSLSFCALLLSLLIFLSILGVTLITAYKEKRAVGGAGSVDIGGVGSVDIGSVGSVDIGGSTRDSVGSVGGAGGVNIGGGVVDGVYAKSSLARHLSTTDRQTLSSLAEAVRKLLPLSVGWMLYDQQSSTWVDQARKMDPKCFLLGYSVTLSPTQMQVLNSAALVLLLPFFNRASTKALLALSLPRSPQHKLVYGMVFFAAAFFCACLLDIALLICPRISVLCQAPQILLLTVGEAFIGTTGLSVAYTLAPSNCKTLMLSFWYLNMALGNLLMIGLSQLFHALSVSFWAQSCFYFGSALATVFFMQHSMHKE